MSQSSREPRRQYGRRVAAAACLLAVVLTAASSAWALGARNPAQTETGRINGSVVDVTGAPLPGASITLSPVAAGTVRTGVSDTNGRYVFANVPPGVYQLTVQLGGYTTAQSSVTVTAGSASVVDTRLEGAPVPPPEPKPWLEVYGFAMLDIGQNFNTINPNWSDTLRVTKLPTFEDQYGKDGSTFAGVRQSRLGVRTSTPTAFGELKTQFEFELFGTGVDEGQTTFRLRHAYGELGAFGAGQSWSPFMDIDVFPNSLEYWGPTGMAFFRNVQVRWMPIKGDTRLTIALERPGASADQGVYANRIELQGINARFPLPDLSGEYRMGGGWGYVEAAGILRSMKWDDNNDDQFNLSGSATGWGVNLSSNLKPAKSSTIRLQLVFGEGIQNYMNDAPVDVGIENNFSNARTPVVGKALPIVGVVAFLDHNWSDRWSSAVGYSRTDIDNTDAQAADAYKSGQYALGNLLFTPVPNVMVGGELQWGRRENLDGFTSDGVKVQFSFKYNFWYKVGG